MLSTLLETERLLLRQPVAADISQFVPLLNDFEVAKNLARVPHPYHEDDGCAFMVRATRERGRGESFVFAILRKSDGAFVGMCGVHPALSDTLGYWIGRPYWGSGYATEAARRVVVFAFDELKAERLTAGWFHDNPASGNVLAKLGFIPDGSEDKDCLSRGTAVFCHKVVVTRMAFRRHG
jgi:RimJ/RimL family protein N-acetyltransferase